MRAPVDLDRTRTRCATDDREVHRDSRTPRRPDRGLLVPMRAGTVKRAWMTAAIAKHAAFYGVLLASTALVLQWFDYQRLARTHWADFYVGLVAIAFLALGVFVGARVFARVPATRLAQGNPQVQATLGISTRELAVLREIAAGRSNKEIARALHIAPSTVKTHAARLYEKLGARRRTDAVNRARELGLAP